MPPGLNAGRRISPRAEPHPLRNSRTFFSVVRRRHRVVGVESPLDPVLRGREVVLGEQVSFQHLQMPSAVQADDVVRQHRLLDRHCRPPSRGCGRSGLADLQILQRLVDLPDSVGKRPRWDPGVRTDNVCSQYQQDRKSVV